MKQHRNSWSPEDEAYLQAHYTESTVEELAAHFGRTVNAVYARAFKLRISRRSLIHPRTILGRRLLERKKALKLTFEFIAIQSGYSKGALTGIIYGSSTPRVALVEDVAAVLKVNPAWLAGWIDDPRPSDNTV